MSEKRKLIKTIDIEGTDGSGKHTTSVFLSEVISLVTGKMTEVVSFPQHDTVQGSLVDEFLYKGLKFKGDDFQRAIREGLLYSTDRMVTMTKVQENGKSLAEEINDGDKFVIFDRYIASNFIHRSKSMNDEDLREYIDIMEFIEYNVMGIPRPDITIVLKVDPEISYQNILKRGREMDDNESLENLIEAHSRIDKLCEMQNYVVIDCCKTVKESPDEPECRVMKTTAEIVDSIIDNIDKIMKEEQKEIGCEPDAIKQTIAEKFTDNK